MSNTISSKPAAALGEKVISDTSVLKPDASFSGSPLALGPPQINNCSVTGHPSEILGLSPSLFSSPGKLPPDQILGDDTEFLTQGELPGLPRRLVHSENIRRYPPNAPPWTRLSVLGAPGWISSQPRLEKPMASWGSSPRPAR